jgi:hypothetical protein
VCLPGPAWRLERERWLKQPDLMSLPQVSLPEHGPALAAGWESVGVFVPGAARAAGGTGDALVKVDVPEHRRRAVSGPLAITDLGLLDRLLNLPLGEIVRWGDLGPDDQRRLRSAPDGTVECCPAGVRRLLTPSASVPLVLVRSRSWRRGLRAVSVFQPFAQRVLVLEDFRRDLAELTWEADVLGVGVWLQTDSGTQEIVSPAPWRQRYFKAAGWRFRERAYQVWLKTSCSSP